MLIDPIVMTADSVIDAALATGADSVRIEPRADAYAITATRDGELLSYSTLDSALATLVIARLSRAKLYTPDGKREMVVTITAGDRPRAAFVVVPEATTPADIGIGDTIGDYFVIAPLGLGGAGDVYEVAHQTQGRRYALKVLNRWHRDRDRDTIERYLRSVQRAARIVHPHIVEVVDVGYLGDGRPFVVMELITGANLASLLRCGAIAPQRALSIARQIADALAAAHEHSVIHGDVSPANVLLWSDRATLIDFGIARLRVPVADDPYDAFGESAAYMSPERIAGFQGDESCDQYAFGALLFELLTGHPPYPGASAREICLAHVSEPIPYLSSPYGPIAASFIAVVERCLAKHPSERFATMRAVVEALAVVAS